jgi:hypothetical protein
MIAKKKSKEEPLKLRQEYQKFEGSLGYIVISRPDYPNTYINT